MNSKTIPQIVEELQKEKEFVEQHATSDIEALRYARNVVSAFPRIAQYLTEQEERIKKLSKSAKEWHDEGYAVGVSDGYNSTEKIVEQERRLGVAREALESMWEQFAYGTKAESSLMGKYSGGLSALEDCEDALQQLSSPQV